MNGTIIEYKTFAVHDGPGIRTTVFLKGCPLKCPWCHNPEAISPRPQLAFKRGKCVLCGDCVRACPEGAHEILNGVHTLDRERCMVCGKCADTCVTGALGRMGTVVSARDVAEELLKDKPYYDRTGGGVTISGGEPLLQSAFVAEVLEYVKAAGVHTAVDTCGEVPFERFEALRRNTDLFLYDIKHIDAERHRAVVGQGNARILENLQRLNACGAQVEIRIPLIPGFNDDKTCLQGIRDFLRTLGCVQRVRVLPYHAMARTKYEMLGMRNTLPNAASPTAETLDEAESVFRGMGQTESGHQRCTC